MVANKRISAWIDQEIFSNLPYPDVLVSAVHALMSGLQVSVDRQITKIDSRSRWQRIIRRKPKLADGQKNLTGIYSALSDMIAELSTLKFAPIDSRIEWTINTDASQAGGVNGSISVKALTVGGKYENSESRSISSTQIVEGSKEQFLERYLPTLREIIARTSTQLSGGFIFVDDLYQIKRDVQPMVLGYMHRLVKDTGIWLKVGSIRYSTITYRQGDPPIGMQIGHDAHEAPLDRGLRHFRTTQNFLEQIIVKIASKADVKMDELLTRETRRRLVLASGGVARDYLRLVSGAITEARNRGVTKKSGSHRIIVEDVNKAAGSLSPSKLTELKADEPDEAASLEQLVQLLTKFCRRNKRAYFLVALNEVQLSAQVNKLQHLRFTHLLEESETVPNEGARRFNVWLLDVAELSVQRATQGMDFTGWETREKRRAKAIIYTSNTKISQPE